MALVEGTPAGYFELDAQPDGPDVNVELVYFGLLPQFIGQGFVHVRNFYPPSYDSRYFLRPR
jgi:hypothetical protein